MKHSASNQQSLVNILLRYWEEISGIEQESSLVVGKGDIRPRIEYFHDAIRAFTRPDKSMADEKRLAVEQLSYDLRCLRYLAEMPLASITHDSHNLSAATSLATTGPGLMASAKRMPRDTKLRLSELYGFYGVLFSALLKATAENDYQERSDTMNQQVEDIHALITAIESGASAQQVATMAAHLDDEAIKKELQDVLPKLKGKDKKALSGLIARLEAATQRKDKELKKLNTAELDYATTQLALYENSKDMLKAMAGQGMNLVGQFVESALRGAKQGRGR